MRNILHVFIGFLTFVPAILHAQTVTDTSTYVNGDMSTQIDFGPTTSDDTYGCSDTLRISIGANRYVTGVDVFYDMEALAGREVSQQRSFVEFLNTNTTEAAVTVGDPNYDSAGVFSYNRNGLTFANGNAGNGDLAFFLHAFRTAGFFPNCGAGNQAVLDSTFKIVVHHIPLPSCTEPTALQVNSVTQNSVTLGWTTGGAAQWQMEYGPVGFATGAGTLVQVSSNPFTISGLTDGTAYDFRVRDSCAVGDVSFWSNTAGVYTLCSAFAAPFLEDFESVDWNTGTGNFGRGTIDTCWVRNYTSSFVFKTGPKNFNSTTTGTNVDHTTGTTTGKYILSERLANTGAPYTATIESPAIYLSTLTVPQLSFWYHMYGAQVGTLSADISTDFGATYTNLWSLSGEQQTSRNAPWLEATSDLSAYINDTVQIKFTVVQALEGGLGDISVDDFAIRETPTCLDPTNLMVDFVWTDKAQVSWTSGGATNWEIEYGAPGFTPGSGTKVGVSANPALITSLSANTSYEVYVRDSCGMGDVSNWVGPISFNTYCNTISATPYLEDFEGANWTKGAANTALGTIETCWQRSPLTPYAWKTGPAVTVNNNSGTQSDHTTGSGQFAYAERLANFNNDTIEAELITPPIDVSTLTMPQLSFWFYMFGNSVVNLNVEINNGSGFTSVYTKTGQQQTSTTDAWQEGIVNLSAYANDTIVIRFSTINNNGGTNNDVSIDDVSVDDAPSCQTPTDLAVLGTTQNSVSLRWTNLGTAAFHNIEYGAPGFALGSGTYISTSSNPSAVAGLSANTTYEFYLRDSCAAGDVSAWLGPISATTDCLPTTAPFVENFDGASWVLGAGGNPGSLDACWRRDLDSAFVVTPGQNGTASGNTGPSGDHTSGTGKFLYTETYFGFAFTPNVTTLSTPLVDISTLTDPELKFYYHAYGADFNQLEVSVFNGTTNTVVSTINGQQQSSNAAAWNEVIVDLAAFAGDTIKVNFKITKAVGVSFQADLALDDISIDEKPACPKPSNLTASNATATSVDLAWTTGGATDWEIEYGTTGFTVGTGTRAAASANPFTLNGLTPSTTYDFYVRDSCGVGTVSEWVGPVTLNTLCTAVPAPYFENFDGASFDPGPNGFGVAGDIDNCWSRNPIASYFWKAGPATPQTNGTGSTIGDHTTGNGGYIFTESGGFVGPPLVADITTPQIDISTLTNPELSYWYHMFGPNVNNLYVQVSTDNGVTYTGVDTLSGNQQTAQSAPWLEAIVDLSAFANQTIVIKFTAEKTSNGNQSDISIDDVKVDEAPNCPKPTALSITAVTSNSATLSWTSGGATNWQIEYGLNGFTQGTGTFVNAASNPFTITGLSAQTDYCFYVRDSCGAGDVSEWSVIACGLTDCGLSTAPFTENFDGAAWTSGAGGANNGYVISSCWAQPTAANPDFSTRTGTTASQNTGPSGDFSGTGNYLFTEASQGATGAGEIASPIIYIPSTMTSPRVGFYYHMYGGDIDSLQVLVETSSGRTAIGSLVGQQQTSNGAAWLQQYFDISSFSGDTIKVVFIGTNNGFNGDISIDEVSVDDAPNCPEPTNLAVTNVGSNSISISWTSGGATNWQIEYGAPGFTSGAGTIVTASTNPFTISGLTPQTPYEFYVRDSCGATSLSAWSTVSVSDTTLCGVFLAPFNENFDGPTFTSGGSIFNPGTIDECWDRITGVNYFWATEQGATASANTGPSADHTSGAGKFMFTDGFGGAANAPLTTPFISLVPLSNPQLRFWYHMYGATINRMEAEVWDGAAWINVWTQTGQQQTANTDPWQEAVVSLNAYAGDTIQVRFIGYRNNGGTSSDMGLDDVQIVDSTGCAMPDSLSLTTATTSSLQINWNSYSSNGSIVKYRPFGSTAPYSFVSAIGGSTTLTGLQAGTTYQIFIRDSCGTDVSLYTSSSLFSTLCGTINAPYFETFDGAGWVEGTGNDNAGDLINACWFRAADTATRWTTGSGTTPSNQTGPVADFNGGGNYIYTEATAGTGTSEIESPSIYLPTSLSSPVLEFYYHMFGQNITSFSIEVNNGSGYTSVKTITGQQQANNFAAWLSDTVDLTTYSGDTIQLKFVGINTGFRGDMAFDNLSITGGSGPCTDPTNITFTNIGSTSATVNWQSNSGFSDVEVVLQGAAQGTGTVYTNVASPFVITGLTSGTAYDVYVKDNCGTNSSAWVNASVTTTGCLALTSGITITNKTPTGFDVNWTSNSGSSTIQVVPAGGGLGSGQTFTPATSPYTITGLLVNTAYDVYVRDDCGTDTTAWITDTASTLSCALVSVSNIGFTRTGLAATFTANFAGQDSVVWSFGNGNFSSVLNPTETYAAPGTYTVIALAGNACGNGDADTLVVEICEAIVPNFTFTNNSDSIFFDASTTTGASIYHWDFGNGSTATGVNVKTPMTGVGSMTVTLIADNACGDSVSIVQTIQLCGPPEARFGYTIISTTSAGMLVQFDGTASTNATDYFWNFGDGNSANGTAVPQNTYLVPSLNYRVTLRVENACGNDHTLSYKLNQIGIEEAAFTKNAYTIFPNPTLGILNIEHDSGNNTDVELSLFDLSGKRLLEKHEELNEGFLKLDISDLPKGSYTLMLKGNSGVAVTKVVRM